MRLSAAVVSFAVCSTSAVSFAQAATQLTQRVPDTWANRSSFFVGARAGIAVPPGARGLAPNASLELGVAPTQGFGFGIRAMWMNSPPGAPALGLGAAEYGFGALADFRYYFETIDPLIIYPTIAVGFLAGPDLRSGLNAVLPLFNPGLGAKLKFGNFYASFEFGVSGFTIPFMAVCAGFETTSKVQRHRERLELAAEEAPLAPEPRRAPAPRVAPVPAPSEEAPAAEAPQSSASPTWRAEHDPLLAVGR